MSHTEHDTTDSQPDGDLDDMLQELRIVLQGTQVMTAFLIILPFNEGFAKIDKTEQWVYLATFICSVAGLILFTAPAVHHRIVRPLKDREGFKRFATRMIIVGQVFVSVAWVLATQFVFAQVLGLKPSLFVAALVAALIAAAWWVLPLMRKNRD